MRCEELLKAAFAYYIAGHYARAFVLMSEVTKLEQEFAAPISLLICVLNRRFLDARRTTLSVFSDEANSDAAVASALEAGELETDEALSRVLTSSLAQAVSSFLEYVKTGQRPLFESALSIVNDAVALARESRLVDWWWWSYCLRHLFREYDGSSLWTQLRPFGGNGNLTGPVLAYARAGLRQTPAVVELWPSQVAAVPIINRCDRPHFLLKMPTSSGKTRIAEMAILRFLMDTDYATSKKCAYVAPFRSLAVEMERTLRSSFRGMGVQVSEIYGGFDFSPAERDLIQQTKVLVATPEKFDAIFRFAPDLAAEVGLVIIDEGHIVDPNERGLRFEFFIQRLIKRLAPLGSRFVFISAVLPNAEEFAEWITGDTHNLLKSNWRPSRLMLGLLSWDGTRTRVDYTHLGQQRFGQECFVPSFIEAVDCRGIAGFGGRRSPFPHDRDEAFALAALRLAQNGATLVFCPQRKQVEHFGRLIEEVLKLQHALSLSRGEGFELPKPGLGTAEWTQCRRIIESETGSDSELVRFLDLGFVVHHAGLPQRVRIALEGLVRSGAIQLVVSTTTLAQGVNLPIKTVLVRGLLHGYGRPVSPLTFWNICGRAGRAMKENEGQILFCIDNTAPARQRRNLRYSIGEMISALEQQAVISAMRRLLEMFVGLWRTTHPHVDVAELCLYLAENKLDWVQDQDREQARAWLDRLDAHLLALCQEFEAESATPDRLDEILAGSLIFIQLRNNPSPILSRDDVLRIFRSRIRYIYRRHPSPSVRFRLYKLGLPLSDCETIEDKREDLLVLFLSAIDWHEWTGAQRVDYLLKIAGFVLSLGELKPAGGLPQRYPALLEKWLWGVPLARIIEEEDPPEFLHDPAKLSLWIEDVCRYRLPWGINSIQSFLASYAEEEGLSLPLVCSYFAAMFKHGVNDPVAMCIVPYLDEERGLALSTARICPHGIDRPDRIVAWLMSVSQRELGELGLEGSVAEEMVNTRERFRLQRLGPAPSHNTSRLRITFSGEDQVAGLSVGEKVLIFPVPQSARGAFQLWTVLGRRLGVFSLPDGKVPEWWHMIHLVDSEVSAIAKAEGGRVTIHIEVTEL
jgi:hypothetical protein